MKKRIAFTFVGIVAAMTLGGGSANADFTFGAPVHLGPPISSPYGDGLTCITTDGLEMYISINSKPGGLGSWDIWVLKRETANDDWGEPENIGAPINTAASDSDAYLSPDGLEMYFTAGRPGGYGDADIWVTGRATQNDPWAQPENLGPVVNTSSAEHYPRISPDGLELYFDSTRPGGYGAEDIWVTKRATKNDPWAEPVNLGSTVNSSASEGFPCLSFDGLLLVFSGDRYSVGTRRPGGYGGSDAWASRRASVSDSWGTPVNLGPMVNSSSHEVASALSSDGHALYFSSERPGGLGGPYGDIYQAPILPIVDFNGDGKVAIEDLIFLIDNWGQSEPLCDIGPMPWGDGIVDAQDLEVLMSYWGQPVNDLALIAHWALDEAEGDLARECVAENDGYVMGDPVWQPMGGQMDGAIQLDGVDDFIITSPVLNPADGPFSVLAWIKGGAPGQAIVSESGGANWLSLDPLTGHLMTELKSASRFGSPLLSQTIITDSQWHRIGFVWDGSYRTLYVDDVAVAEDTQVGLEGSSNGLYFGVSGTLAPNTFWFGLIDDIRIYNRAVSP